MNIITFTVKTDDNFGGEANGYVAIPPSHPLHGCHYYHNDFIEHGIKVHNGVTYSAYADDSYSVTKGKNLDIPDNYWVLGFHTQSRDDDKQTWNLQRVIEETERLKTQIQALK